MQASHLNFETPPPPSLLSLFLTYTSNFAGHYVPQLAELVYDRNKDKTKYPTINLKGFIVRKPPNSKPIKCYFDMIVIKEF